MSLNRQKDFVHISHDPELDIIQGTRSNIFNKETEGVSTSLASGVDKCVWAADKEFVYTTNSNESNLSLVSTNANDSLSGTGARKILIEGLVHSLSGSTHSYTKDSEEIQTFGASAVSLTKAFYRITKMTVIETGSAGVNQGDITINDTATSSTFGAIAGGDNVSNMAVLACPSQHSILVQKLHVSAHYETPVELKVNIFEESTGHQKTIYKFFLSSNTSHFSFNVRKRLDAGATMWVSVNPLATVTGSHNRVSVLLEAVEKQEASVIPSLV